MHKFTTCDACKNPLNFEDKRKRIESGKWIHDSCWKESEHKPFAQPHQRENGKKHLPIPVLQGSSLNNGNGSVALGSSFLEVALRDFIEKNKADVTHLETYMANKISALLGNGESFTRRLEIKYPDQDKVKQINHPHKHLDKLLNLIASGQDVYLHGDPGTGKSTGANQVAQILELPYAYVSLCPQSSETLLFGFNHAGGQYVETEFFRLYRDGGVFCIDEMDNGSGTLLNKLNSLLENGHGSFPCGTIPRNPKFVMVGTGNTNGNGGSLEFPDRRAFDPAFKERFAFLEWPLDTSQEKLIASSISPLHGLRWLDVVVKIRKAIKELGIERIVVSPRATYKGAMLLNGGKFDDKEILDMLVFKGLPKNTVKQITDKVEHREN